VEVKIANGKLTVSGVNLLSLKDAPVSSTGKSKVLYSSKGFKFTDENIGVSLNVIQPLKEK